MLYCYLCAVSGFHAGGFQVNLTMLWISARWPVHLRSIPVTSYGAVFVACMRVLNYVLSKLNTGYKALVLDLTHGIALRISTTNKYW